MNGVTSEMVDWYSKYRAGNNLAYKIWYPGSHLDEVTEDGYGPREDVGFGTEVIMADKILTYKDLGFTADPREKDPLFERIVSINSHIKNEQYPELEPRAFVLFHYIRSLPDGDLEYITHLYLGMHIEDGKVVVKQNIEPAVCLEVMRQMLLHCMTERKNMEYFLPELYESLKDTDLSDPKYHRGFANEARK